MHWNAMFITAVCVIFLIMLYSLETKIIDANNGDFRHTFSYRGRRWHDRKPGRFREEQDICLVGQLDCGKRVERKLL